jgi:RNA polymerase sigma factor (sigma-70 family)
MKDNTKCFILTINGYEEITYKTLTKLREDDLSYQNRKFISLHGMLMEVSEADYKVFYRDRRRQRYLREESIRVGEVSYNALDTDEMSGEETIADPSEPIDQMIVDKLDIESILSCLDKLSEAERDLLFAVFYQRKTERVLAKELNISQPAVHKRIQKIIGKIREYLEI